MSETLRSYSGSKRGLSFGAARRGGRGVLPGALLLFMLGVFVAAFWISRDTHDIDEFLQADRPVQVRIEHAINSRNTLAESPVWAVLPGNSTGNVRAALREPLPVPEWLARNVLNREVYWFGDFESGEGVIVSRMTRVGTIAARLSRWTPAIDRDWAGGLDLLTLHEQGLFFAVRGRILIAGNSRRALIDALTLDRDERVEFEGYLQTGPENAQLAGSAALSPEIAARLGVDRVEFGVVMGDDRFGLVARGKLTVQQSALAEMLRRAAPATLSAPIDAPAALVVNVDTPLKELSIAFADAVGSDWPGTRQWEEWSTPPDSDRGRPGAGELLAQLGPEIHLTIHDVDPNEVLPVPELVIRDPLPPVTLRALTESFPAPRTGPSLDAVRASYDESTGLLRFPAPGGDSLEPSGTFITDQFVFSTSLARLKLVAAAEVATPSLPGTNNLYLRIEPSRLLDTIGTAGEVLAENALLEGHTPETFSQKVSEWREQTRTIESLEAVLRTANDTVVLECEMRFNSR